MDKSTVIVFSSLLLNLMLVAGIVYVHYFFPLTRSGRERQEIIPEESLSGKKPYRVAVLKTLSEIGINNIADGFVETLKKELTVSPHVTVYDANGSRTLMRSQIEDAVAHNVDLLVPIGSQVAQMAKEITLKRGKLIPILFMGTGDPEKLELVESVERSGNHVTGVTPIGRGWINQMIELIPHVYPSCKRVIIPYDPTGLGGALESYKDTYLAALDKAGIEAKTIKVYSLDDVIKKVPAFLDGADMLITLPDATLLASIDAVSKMCNKKQVPMYLSMNLRGVRRGAAMSFGFYGHDMGMLGAQHACKILDDGVAPTSLPVNGMGGTYKLMINMKAAHVQGLADKIDASMLQLMENTEVIEGE